MVFTYTDAIFTMMMMMMMMMTIMMMMMMMMMMMHNPQYHHLHALATISIRSTWHSVNRLESDSDYISTLTDSDDQDDYHNHYHLSKS